MSNVAGLARTSFFQDVNATNWSASFQDLSPTFLGSENGPDFEHLGPSAGE
jgi:hypothetical protein